MLKKPRARTVFLAFIAILIIVLVAARLYLPIWLKDYVNAELAKLEGYSGSVEDIDVALIRGAYVIHDLKIIKRNANMPVPFLTAKTVDLSVQWGALIKGRIVSEINIDTAIINFATNKSGRVTQTGAEGNWSEAIQNLMPIDINLITLSNSKVTYRDFSTTPEVNIFVNDINGEIRNLRNIDDASVALPSPFRATGTSIGGGKMQLRGKANILRKFTDLDGDLKLEGMDLTAINSYSRAYAAIDFEKGSLNSYSELVIKDGRVRGYFKPIATNLEIIDLRMKDKNLLEVIWEPVAAGLIEIFSNQGKDQFATRVEFEGRIDNVETPFWPTVGGILRNAFVQAFSHRIEGTLDFTIPKFDDEE